MKIETAYFTANALKKVSRRLYLVVVMLTFDRFMNEFGLTTEFILIIQGNI
jgi:hypothetical protein